MKSEEVIEEIRGALEEAKAQGHEIISIEAMDNYLENFGMEMETNRRELLSLLGRGGAVAGVLPLLNACSSNNTETGEFTADKSQQGFSAFHDRLQELHQWVESYPGLSEKSREEGRDYIAGMAHLSMRRAFICSDIDFPRFITNMDRFSHWGLGNPDNIYLSAEIQGNTEYLIRGNCGSCADIAYEILADMIGDDGKTSGSSVSYIDLGTLECDLNGNYEIRVGGNANGMTNWVASSDAANTIFVRKSYEDWSNPDTGWQTIERVQRGETGPRPGGGLSTHDRWLKAAAYLKNQLTVLDQLAAWSRENMPVNAISAATDDKGAGFYPGQYNSWGQFNLDENEVLLISTEPVDCRYASVAIGDYQWFTTYESSSYQSSLNRHQSFKSSDGSYHYVISAVDPGVPNWLDTTGYGRGLIFCRWQGIVGEPPKVPSVKLLGRTELRAILPADTPVVSSAERASAINARRIDIDRRYSV